MPSPISTEHASLLASALDDALEGATRWIADDADAPPEPKREWQSVRAAVDESAAVIERFSPLLAEAEELVERVGDAFFKRQIESARVALDAIAGHLDADTEAGAESVSGRSPFSGAADEIVECARLWRSEDADRPAAPTDAERALTTFGKAIDAYVCALSPVADATASAAAEAGNGADLESAGAAERALERLKGHLDLRTLEDAREPDALPSP